MRDKLDAGFTPDGRGRLQLEYARVQCRDAEGNVTFYGLRSAETYEGETPEEPVFTYVSGNTNDGSIYDQAGDCPG